MKRRTIDLFSVSLILFTIPNFLITASEENISESSTHKSINLHQHTTIRESNYNYTKDTQSVILYSDLLLWKPITNSIDWADDLKFSIPSNRIENYQGKQKNVTLPYAFGFRLGAGYRFKQNALGQHSQPWQMEAVYDWLYTSSTQTAYQSGTSSYSITDNGTAYINTGNTVQPIIPTLLDGNNVSQSSFTKGSSKLSLGYNKGDIKISWPLWIGNNIILRFGSGASFAYVNSTWKNKFLLEKDPLIGNPSRFLHSNLKWNWWGGGLLAFGDINIEISKGFGFVAETAFAFLFGQMNQNEKDTPYIRFEDTDQNKIVNVTSSRSYYSFQPAIKFAIGFNYKHWYHATKLYTSAGWEVNYWPYINQFGKFGQGNLGRVMLTRNPQYLLFEGLTYRLGVEF